MKKVVRYAPALATLAAGQTASIAAGILFSLASGSPQISNQTLLVRLFSLKPIHTSNKQNVERVVMENDCCSVYLYHVYR